MTTPTGHRTTGRLIDLAGQTFGTLTVLHRGAPHPTYTDAMWVCSCTCGRTHTARALTLRSGATRSCGDRAAHPINKQPTADRPPAYNSTHRALRRALGPATAWNCINGCGRMGAEWSLDPLPGHPVIRRGPVLAFSTDPEAYVPRCLPCHRALDAMIRRELVSA